MLDSCGRQSVPEALGKHWASGHLPCFGASPESCKIGKYLQVNLTSLGKGGYKSRSIVRRGRGGSNHWIPSLRELRDMRSGVSRRPGEHVVTRLLRCWESRARSCNGRAGEPSSCSVSRQMSLPLMVSVTQTGPCASHTTHTSTATVVIYGLWQGLYPPLSARSLVPGD